jgi:hypothetical protein
MLLFFSILAQIGRKINFESEECLGFNRKNVRLSVGRIFVFGTTLMIILKNTPDFFNMGATSGLY